MGEHIECNVYVEQSIESDANRPDVGRSALACVLLGVRLDVKFEDACPKLPGGLRLCSQLHSAHVHRCFRVAPIALLWLYSFKSTRCMHLAGTSRALGLLALVTLGTPSSWMAQDGSCVANSCCIVPFRPYLSGLLLAYCLVYKSLILLACSTGHWPVFTEGCVPSRYVPPHICL